MNRRSRVLLPALLAGSLVVTACGSEVTALPAGLGPIALTTDITMPSDCTAGNASGSLLTIGPSRAVLGNPSYNERKARGCVPYPVAQVWQAWQEPAGVELGFWAEREQSECQGWLLTDPDYPLSFVTKEIPRGSALVQQQWFEVTWRAGVTQGTASAPTEVKVIYGKTAGTTQVPKILGSMVFTADPVHPGWTQVDIVRQLNTNGWSDEPAQLDRWIQEFYSGLVTQLSQGSLPVTYCVLQ
jgi:hypothetical protein